MNENTRNKRVKVYTEKFREMPCFGIDAFIVKFKN